MNIKNFILPLIVSFTITASSQGQRGQGMGQGMGQGTPPEGGAIAGKVVDNKSQQAIEYANITVYSSQDSSLISGGISNSEGMFRVEQLTPGNYYATIKFIGYQKTIKENISISKVKPFVRLGLINLEPSAHNLNEVEVMADKQQVVYKIDKKVVNPSQFMVAQGGNAVDILANTPSVQVDIEGNVSMRGSSNFTVLINGKPTPFEPSDALAQIPASSIENIEIITNPSAKYDPDGAAGIINIITKSDGNEGWDGIVNASVSTLGAYGGDFLLNFAGDKARFYIGGGRSDRLRYADYSNTSGTIKNGDTTHIEQVGERKMNFISYSLKSGVDYSFNDKNSLGLELQLGQRQRLFDSQLDNNEWSSNGPTSNTYANAITDALSTSYQVTINQNSQLGDNKEHRLISSLMYQHAAGDDKTYSNKKNAFGESLITQNTWEEESENEVRFKTDYTRPWEKGKFEAGYQMRYDQEWSNFDAHFNNLNELENSKFYFESDFSRIINGAYFTFSGEQGQLGYQVGLRGEHTLRQLEDQQDSLISDINRMDWYPTLHLSYNLDQNQAVMLSYTRRIDRPRGYWLEPTLTWRDPNNVRQGNPNLLPQYVNSYEMSYQLRFGERNFLSAEVFHRQVEDKIERTRNKYQDGVLMTKFENVGEDFSTGVELMLNYNINSWWSANLSASVYDYRIEAYPEFRNALYENQSNNWRTRLSNTFKAGQTLRFQVDGMYNSASVTATGKRSAMAFTSVAVKKSFFNRKLDLGLSVFDVLNTAKMQSYSSSDTYYSEFEFDMKSPFVQFSISYLFNNYKPEMKRGQGEGGSMDMEF